MSGHLSTVGVIRWDEKAGPRGMRHDQVIDVLEAQINKETGNEEGQLSSG
jgi:hypothetical protein